LRLKHDLSETCANHVLIQRMKGMFEQLQFKTHLKKKKSKLKICIFIKGQNWEITWNFWRNQEKIFDLVKGENIWQKINWFYEKIKKKIYKKRYESNYLSSWVSKSERLQTL